MNELHPYTQREVMDSAAAIPGLLENAEQPLKSHERQRLYDYALELQQGVDLQGLPLLPLQEVIRLQPGADSQKYYTGYFDTPEGLHDISTIFNTPSRNHETLMSMFYEGPATATPQNSKELKIVAANSLKWYKQQLAEQLSQPQTTDADFKNSPTITVKANPELLLEKFEHLQEYRQYYREMQAALVAEDLEDENSNKQVLLNMYRARVNNMLATMYPSLLGLADQLQHSPQTALVQGWQQRIFAAAPIARRLFKDIEPEDNNSSAADTFLRRLDLLRNGAEFGAEGNFSPIADELGALADEIEGATVTAVPPGEQIYSDEVVEQMRETTWDSTQMQEFCGAVLDEWSLLSADQATWDEVDARHGPAADDRWQIIVTPKVAVIDVDGIKKVFRIPESFNRTLIQVSPAGALPVAAHELQHILQCEYDIMLAKQLPLAEIKGRRALTGREMGGIFEERQVQAMVGQTRPANTTYTRALEAKLRGGNQAEVARAFLVSDTKDPNADAVKYPKQAVLAADRILRLYRNGGYNSQPLDYLEQELLSRKLEAIDIAAARTITTCATSFSFRDASILRDLGIIELPKTIDFAPAETVMKVYFDRFYAPPETPPSTIIT